MKHQKTHHFSDYYPFGMLLPNRHESSNEYRYGFQGQEKDDEIKGEGNSVNYKYRMHDPRIGRFFAVDPSAYEYPYYSPYVFSGNRVIDSKELEGLQPGVLFSSAEDAAKNFSEIFGAYSITENREYGATVYETKNDEGQVQYFYNNPISGKEKEVKSNKPSIKNSTPVNGIHAHGAYKGRVGGNSSSGQDKSTVGAPDGIPEYIAVPSGELLLTSLITGEDPKKKASYKDVALDDFIGPNDGADPENIDPGNIAKKRVLPNRGTFKKNNIKENKKFFKSQRKEHKKERKKYKKEYKKSLKKIEN